MSRIVFMGKPGLSGNYTHFKYLRDNCLDVKFYLLSLGDVGPSEIEDTDYINIGKELDRKEQQRELAQLFLKFCDEYHVDIIIPMNSGIVASCLPFLRKEKVIQIINTNTPRVYHYVTTSLDYTSKVVCISQRQQEVLKLKMSPEEFDNKTLLIPHGVSYHSNLNKRPSGLPLTIGFLGRIHQGHKGVFKIPEILKKLSFPYVFEIVGEGKDQVPLIQRLKDANISFTFKGSVLPEQINKIIEDWDILLFPSLIEGFPLTLIEAMNNGVVPIANLLPGITDFIITSGKDGFTIKDNRVADYVGRIGLLNDNREMLYQMKLAAKETVQQRFELSLILTQYRKLFREVLAEKKQLGRVGFSEWSSFKEYKPSIIERIKSKMNTFLLNR